MHCHRNSNARKYTVGSVITGQTAFTTNDCKKGTEPAVTPSTNANGYAVNDNVS